MELADSGHTHTQTEYYNPRAHARRALTMIYSLFIIPPGYIGIYRTLWLLSACAYKRKWYSSMRLIKDMRLYI